MKASIFVLALALTAGTAMANGVVSASYRPMSDGMLPQTRANNAPVFSAIPGPYAGFAAATGGLGFDDYNSIFAGPTMPLQVLNFVGGVTTVGGTLTFNFYDTTQTLANTVAFNLPAAGNFIWTLNFESAPGAKDSLFSIPSDGYLEIIAGANTTGQWFLSTSLPTIGTESRAAGEGSLTTHSHRFELVVPAPGAMALLGLGGLVAARRRR